MKTRPTFIWLLALALTAAVAFNAGRFSKRDVFIKVDCETPAAARERMRTPFVTPEQFAVPAGGLTS